MTDECTPLPGMIGNHPSMRAVYSLVRRAAPTGLSMVIQGETGTGKELVARAIHDLSGVHGECPAINCAAIPESLVEAELFGSVRGSFTSSIKETIGLLDLAHNGTLFLDEACSLPLAVQAKLLRAIECREFRRVGGRAVVRSQFRLVTAMTRTLDELVASGAYLAAFAHRICGVEVMLPPLAKRGRDIRLLAEGFLADVAAQASRPLSWSEEALDQLAAMPWPGNVRELQQLVARLPIHIGAEERIEVGHVQAARRQSPATCTADSMRAAVERHDGNFSRAARELGMPRTTLRERLLRTTD